MFFFSIFELKKTQKNEKIIISKIKGGFSMNNLIAFIVANNEGNELKSRNSKFTQKVVGKSLIEWTHNSIKGAGINECFVIVGQNASQIKNCLGEKLNYLVSDKSSDIPLMNIHINESLSLIHI